MAREVDRLLAGLSALGARPAHDQRPRAGAPTPNRVTPRSVPRISRAADAPSRGDRAALWARVVLGIVLGGVMTQWPYPHACALPLVGYLGAVAMVMVAGVWIAVVSWGLRSPLAHVLALLVFFWGIVLAAEQVLPRVGYAAEHLPWRC